MNRKHFDENPISSIENLCNTCQKKTSFEKSTSKKITTFLSLLVLILPKCPFCFVAYSSAMTMCGTPAIVSHHIDWGAYLALGLGGIVLFCIARNYRGAGTRRAIVIAILGLILVAFGIYRPSLMIFYYLGSFLMLIAAFYNGSGFGWMNQFFLKFSIKTS